MDPIQLIREGKVKRFFRATKKLNVPELVYHITQRGAGREPLFIEDDDYLSMLALMKEICEKHSLKMYAFCLMPNHIHLLLSPTHENLSEAMRDLFSKYAMRFNRKYQRKGHLFGGPYRQATCLDDSYLLATSLYIHLNPVKAGLANNPIDYRWSSSRLYCKGRKIKSFVDPDFILNILPGTKPEKREKYSLLLARGAGLGIGQVLENEDAIEVFSSKLASLSPELFKIVQKSREVAKRLGIRLLSMEELDDKIEEIRRNPQPNKPETRRAKRFVIEQLIARGFKRSEIAHRLGMSRKAVYNILKAPLQ